MKKLYIKCTLASALALVAVNAFSASPFVVGQVVSAQIIDVAPADSNNQQFCADLKDAFDSANVTATIRKDGLPIFKDSTKTFKFTKVTFVQEGNRNLRQDTVTYHAKNGDIITDKLTFDHDDNDANNMDTLVTFGGCKGTFRIIMPNKK